jgi:hypothetical protein
MEFSLNFVFLSVIPWLHCCLITFGLALNCILRNRAIFMRKFLLGEARNPVATGVYISFV